MRSLSSRMSFFLRVEFVHHLAEKSVFLWEIAIRRLVKLTFPAGIIVPIHFAALDVLNAFSVGKFRIVLSFRRTVAKR